MIRHSSSFFISIILHIILFIALLYGYKNINFTKKESIKKVKISLCNVQKNQKPIKNIKVPPLVKVIPKVNVKKVIKRPKIKKIEEKKVIIKKEKKKEKIIQKKEVLLKPAPAIEIKIKKPVVQEIINVQTKEEKNIQLEKNYINEHIQQITQLLRDNLYYPRSARKRGITGNILVQFKLSISGEVHSIKVVDSQSDILSRAAIKTIKNVSDEFPIPSEELLLHVPINYTLSR